MSIGKGGQSGNQSGSSSNNFTGNTSGSYTSDTSQTGTSTSTQTGTASGQSTATPTQGYGDISTILQGMIGNKTGLNAGQQDAYNQLLNWRENPNNTVNQITGVNGQIQDWIKQNAPQLAGPQQVTATNVNPNQGAAYMGPYRNAYDDQVVNSTIADNNLALGKSLNDLRATYGGQMGNGRGDVAAGTAVSDSLTRLAPILAGVRQQGFTTALGAGQTDASRQLQGDISNQAIGLQASEQNASNDLQKQIVQAQLDAAKQSGNYNALNGLVSNIATAGGIGTDTAKTLFDMAGGGNTNLLNFLQSQVPAFGRSTTGSTSGTQTGSTSSDTSSTGTSQGSTSGSQSGVNSGSSSGKNGGVSIPILGM